MRGCLERPFSPDATKKYFFKLERRNTFYIPLNAYLRFSAEGKMSGFDPVGKSPMQDSAAKLHFLVEKRFRGAIFKTCYKFF